MKWIDRFLNSITMYRLVLYGLLVILGYAVIIGFGGLLPYRGEEIFWSALFLYLICLGTNAFWARVLSIQVNVESATITSLILALILSPVSKPSEMVMFSLSGVLAMTSKYVLAIDKKHLFNPAAISLFILGFMGYGSVVWWVGSSIMLPVVLIVGVLVIRKIRRGHLFLAFLITAVAMVTLGGINRGVVMRELFNQMLISWPIFFFGTIMLTEPQTTPPTKRLQIIYGFLTGFLFGSSFQTGPLFSTPELALVLGNLFSYFVSFKQKLMLTLKQKVELAPGIFEFVFSPDKKLKFTAGQYLEWTLGHKNPDNRGSRRYFTVASAPTEPEVRLAIRFDSDRSSSFKKTLLKMGKGEQIVASQLAGDFVLPNDPTEKLVFVAGGIGVTPFRSMIKCLMDTKETRQIVFYYLAKSPTDFVYKGLFDKAQSIGIKMVYVITEKDNVPKNWSGKVGHLDPGMIESEVPDFLMRRFYLSGPSGMVDSLKSLLTDMGVNKKKVVTDYFPGY